MNRDRFLDILAVLCDLLFVIGYIFPAWFLMLLRDFFFPCVSWNRIAAEGWSCPDRAKRFCFPHHRYTNIMPVKQSLCWYGGFVVGEWQLWDDVTAV